MTSDNQHEHKDLSIIIISYNTAELTANCIRSIYDSMQDIDEQQYEIIVLDNASQDDSIDKIGIVAQEHTNLRLIISKENLGFSKGNNKAAKEAKGFHLLFLNSDIIVLQDAIPKLLTYYKQHANIAFLGGKLLNADHSPQPSCGPFYTPLVVFAALFLKGDYIGLTRYSPIDPRKVDWVSGACILTTKEHFLQMGGFDEQIFMYMEEIDLLYRAKKLKKTTYIYPDSQFIHLGSASSGGKTFPILQVYKGFIFFYRKHYGPFYLAILRSMLQLKAILAILIAIVFGNTQLKKTYEQALTISRLA